VSELELALPCIKTAPTFSHRFACQSLCSGTVLR
jgi:hypothetical protein